jgi:hypothetical protein
LKFGKAFSQDIYGYFPNVTHLTLPYKYYKKLKGKPQFGRPLHHPPWYKIIPSVTHLYLITDSNTIECKYQLL